MFGLGKPNPIAEYQAEGETARIYHEIRQVLRVTGVNLNFRTWAAFDQFFPLMWEASRPNLETRAFENAADSIRAQSVESSERLGRLGAAEKAALGASQAYQIKAALKLYHYVNPKLLLHTAMVRLALSGEQLKGSAEDARPALIGRGVPERMYPMEMVSEEPDDRRLRALFDDIRTTLSLTTINSDYRTLGLWPDYLSAGWRQLKPITQTPEYRAASDQLRETARTLARGLPYPVLLSQAQLKDQGEKVDQVVSTTEQFERLLPSLILNISLLLLDWRSAEEPLLSPFPAPGRSIDKESQH